MNSGINMTIHPAASPFEWPQATKNDLKTFHLLSRLERLGLIASRAFEMSSAESGQRARAWRTRTIQAERTEVIMLGEVS